VAHAKGDPLKRIRILLARMPTLMLDVLHHIVAAEPNMVVVGVVDEDNLLAAARRARADVLIVGQAKDEDDDYAPLLFRQPRLKVLAIADSGRTGALYELRPRRIALGEISARTLARAIRRHAPPISHAGAAARRPVEVH
jgi:DNA-binding NarL/FixJ family response regulator